MKFRLGLFLLIALAAPLIGFKLLDPEIANLALRHSVFLFLLIAVVCFAWLVTSEYGKYWLAARKSKSVWAVTLACLAATTFLFTREPPDYKISFDEPVLISTSLNLHLDRDPVMEDRPRADVPTEAIRLDKRPFLFPFLVSILHDLTGYRVANGHVANFLFTFGLFVCLFNLCKRIKDAYAGYACVALCCALPLLAQNASGLGMDILNIFLIAVVQLAGIQFLSKPSDRRMGILLLATVLLAHTRYESALYALATGLIILLHWIKSRSIRIPWTLIVTPLFFIPLAWHQTVIWSDASYMQLAEGEKAFSTLYFTKNIVAVLTYFFTHDETIAGSAALGIFSLLSLLAILASYRLKLAPSIYCFAAVTLFSIGMLLFYYWGHPTDRMATRLMLPLWMLMIPACALFLSFLAKERRWFPPLIIAGCILFALPMMNKHLYTKNIPTHVRSNWCKKVLKDSISDRTLVLTFYTRMFQNMGVPSFGLNRAVGRIEGLVAYINMDVWDDIYIIQNGHYKMEDGELIEVINSGYKLGPAFKLEPIDQASFLPYNFVRVSKLISIDSEMVFDEKMKAQYIEPYFEQEHVPVFPISAEADEIWYRSFP